MYMSKFAFIIPGYGEDKNSRPAYGQIANAFKKRGYKVLHAPVKWKEGRSNRNFADIVPEFVSFVREHTRVGDSIVLQGFSFGAVIALMSAPELKPTHMLLCSLSPYFKQDLAHIPKWWIRGASKKKISELRTLDFNKYVGTKSRVTLFRGEKEGKYIESRARDAHNKIKHSKLIVIPGAKHDIGNPTYLAAIKEEISKL